MTFVHNHLATSPRPVSRPASGGEGIEGVQYLDPTVDARWDLMIASFPTASFFQSSSWARVLCASYNYRPYYVANTLGGIYSLIPLMEVESWVTGRRGISLPFTDECNPLCPNSDSFQKVFRDAQTLAIMHSWRYLECRGGGEWLNGAAASESFFGHRLDLRDAEGYIFNRLEGGTRGAIAKASRSGLIVEFSQSIEDIFTFYDLMCKTRRRQGLPPQPYKFFKNIHRYILSSNQGCIALALLEGKPIAGAIFLHFRKITIYKFAASEEKFRSLCPNNLVLWEAILWHQKRGFDLLEFGRTAVNNHGLRKFKLSWSPIEYKIEYFRYYIQSMNFGKSKECSFMRAHSIFKLLPTPLSKMAGAALYRHVA